MPTVLDLVGRRAPEGMQGTSLVPLMTGQPPISTWTPTANRSTRGTTTAGASSSRCGPAGSSTSPRRGPSSTISSAIRANCRTSTTSAGRSPTAWRQELGRLGAEDRLTAGGPSAVDPETRERLAALGYIGSFATTAAQDGEALPDPKDKIDIFNLMTSAREATARSETTAAIDRLPERRRAGPEHPRRLGHARQRVLPRQQTSRRAGAVQARAADQARLRPGDDQSRRRLPGAGRLRRRDCSATSAISRRIRRTPGSGISSVSCTSISISSTKRRRAFQQALADDTRVASARNALGVVAFRRGDLASAEQEIRAAIAQKPDVQAGALQPRADRRAARGRADRRSEEYQQEIDTQPGAFKAAFNLGKLYEQLGNPAEQEAAFLKAIELNPRLPKGTSTSRSCTSIGSASTRRWPPRSEGSMRARRRITPPSATTCSRICTAGRAWPPSPRERPASAEPARRLQERGRHDRRERRRDRDKVRDERSAW